MVSKAAFTYKFDNWVLHLVIKPDAYTHDKKVVYT